MREKLCHGPWAEDLLPCGMSPFVSMVHGL